MSCYLNLVNPRRELLAVGLLLGLSLGTLVLLATRHRKPHTYRWDYGVSVRIGNSDQTLLFDQYLDQSTGEVQCVVIQKEDSIRLFCHDADYGYFQTPEQARAQAERMAK